MQDAEARAPSERGWGKLLLALVAFLIIPPYTPLRALLPVEDTFLLLLPALAACTHEQHPLIIAHRAQGVGEHGESVVENVAKCFEAGFGAEIDVRGDGELDFELGHLEPQGHDLAEVFAAIDAAWELDFVGRVLVIDIANDGGNRVSDGLMTFLHKAVEQTKLEQLRFVIQSSNEETLDRLLAHHADAGGALDVRFATTYWTAPEYTPPDGLDLVTANAKEIGDLPYPKPLMLFGVESRAMYRNVEMSASDVYAVITDHPRRIAELQGE